jgi:hypothetical protein
MSLNKMIKTNAQMRILGIAASIASLCAVIYFWYVALNEGVYWPKASMIFPFTTFLFLSVAFDPITTEECVKKYGSEQLSWLHMPFRQKALIIGGVIAGILNWAFLSGKI